ncbi:type IV pilus biogenesis/stability protein PilW [Abyssibacter sp.]|uniref:type IV pilus biogenesis/stability protein PilW n=1 Tax=Abyssibacter sp. TaxID=2320200 RepID=UPI0025BAABF1|nr:type IV pilus biogenesis/stability protein PilW [Abyssibacter sp.]MCK5857797.1 type IV pilus biogenesis/stability protein PilW [Abyssibacter sp.]
MIARQRIIRGWLWAGVVLATLTACVTESPDGTYARSDADYTEAARINTQLGIDYMRKGETDRALSKLQRAVEQDPSLALAHASIAFVYQNRGDRVSADRHYRRAIALAPNSPDTQNNYGVFLCGQSRYDEALLAFDRALRVTGYRTPEVAQTNAGVCARKAGLDARAEGYFRAALRENSTFPNALAQIALLSYDRGEYLLARAFLQRYSQAAPHSPQTLWLGVRTERALGDVAAARRYATQLQQQFPEAEETYSLLRSERNG